MDDQELHPEADASTYSILTFRGRGFPDQYLGLIIATWTKSLRHNNDWFRLITPRAYYESYRLVILNILSKPETEVRLAVLTEDPDVTFGYCVYRNNILDYVFVLADYRRHGIGKMLVPDSIDMYTHVTNLGRDLVQEKKLDWLFNPFL